TGKSLAATSVWSGAPIGDASTYTYGGTDISLNNPTYGDSLAVSNFSSAPIGIQIYRIDTMPNYTTAPLGFSVLATKYYYGVFIIGSTSPTYKMSYYYKGNPQVGVVSLFDMASRTDNSTTTWTAVTTILNTGIKALQKSSQSGRNEYIPTLKTGGLPIKLRSFTAIADGNQVDLNWATETEVNNNYFTIERTTDGVNYEAIATVKGAGNSDAELNYKATDESPVQGTSYYRLRQTDFDGNSQEFAPIAVNFSSNLSNTGFTLNNTYPNPFSNSFTMTFNSDKVQQLSIVIMSSNGTVIDNDAINCTEGNNTYNYNKGAMLSTGIYFVCVTDHSNGQKTVQKIVKL
ncbi:MAG TPA: T9SS type A sorting domain-containing protein, partial [Bacteroidia bacterium]|nr:T9SS type A sorting domain-containing protein [Bacteroidia bacterium]